MPQPVTPDAVTHPLAAALLDAQVEWAVAKLTGDGLVELLAVEVQEALRIGADLTLATAVDATAVKLIARRLVDVAGNSSLLTEVVEAVAEAVYDLPGAKDHKLGDVVDRAHVQKLVVKVIGMHRAQDRIMERMQQSPTVAAVATKFVGQIVADLVQENRQRVEKLPGAKSLMSLGMGAASKVRNATADTFIGDAAGRSAQYAIKRTNSATRELIRDAPLEKAALELWDIQAAEPMSDLRSFVSAADVQDLAQILHAMVADARTSDYVTEAVDAGIDAFFDLHGDTPVSSLLDGLGIGADDILFALSQAAPQLLTALRDSGELERIVRTRLAPFYAADSVQALLDGGEAPARSAPAKKTPAKKAPVKAAAKPRPKPAAR